MSLPSCEWQDWWPDWIIQLQGRYLFVSLCHPRQCVSCKSLQTMHVCVCACVCVSGIYCRGRRASTYTLKDGSTKDMHCTMRPIVVPPRLFCPSFQFSSFCLPRWALLCPPSRHFGSGPSSLSWLCARLCCADAAFCSTLPLHQQQSRFLDVGDVPSPTRNPTLPFTVQYNPPASRTNSCTHNPIPPLTDLHPPARYANPTSRQRWSGPEEGTKSPSTESHPLAQIHQGWMQPASTQLQSTPNSL